MRPWTSYIVSNPFWIGSKSLKYCNHLLQYFQKQISLMNLPYFLLKGQMFSLAMDLVGLVRSLPVLLSSISCMWILLGVIQMGRRRQWHPTLVLLPGKSYGRRSLVGCSPWGREESDMTERLHFHFSLSCIGGRNGNPFQYSCLENPRDSGAWWAAVYGITQSWTQLNRLRSIQMGTG